MRVGSAPRAVWVWGTPHPTPHIVNRSAHAARAAHVLNVVRCPAPLVPPGSQSTCRSAADAALLKAGHADGGVCGALTFLVNLVLLSGTTTALAVRAAHLRICAPAHPRALAAC